MLEGDRNSEELGEEVLCAGNENKKDKENKNYAQDPYFKLGIQVCQVFGPEEKQSG